MSSVATLPSPNHRRKLIIATAIALLLHLLALEYSRWIELVGSAGAPAPVAIHEVDPRKLEEIQRQWKERALLLQKDRAAPDKTVPAPKDARYMSDRNTRVEEERRARQTAPIPHAVNPAPPQARKLPKLAQLGVRLPKPSDRAPPDPGETGDQALLDRHLKEGDRNLLNTVESVYYSYYSRLYQAIAPIWNSRIRQAAYTTRGIVAGEYIAHADVVFDREGNLREVRILQSSGVPAFDEAIHYAWRKIQRFPNPPRDLLDASGEVHTGWSFAVNLDANSGFQFYEPERTY